MPAGTRIRGNNSQGTVSDNPLAAGATTLNSAGLANLPAVAVGNHAVIVLDPLRTAGVPEIVVVTAHSAAATSATVARGAYGTTARQHASGVAWVHAPTIDDMVQVLTSSTRPSDPYRGQLIFETDTNSFVARDTSDAWQTVVQMGAWLTWTPVVTQGNTPAQTVNWARYSRVGRLITAHFRIALTGAGTAANDITLSGFPAPAADVFAIGGSFRYFDVGNTNRVGTIVGATTTTAKFTYDGFGNNMGGGDFAIASNDVMQGIVLMEADA